MISDGKLKAILEDNNTMQPNMSVCTLQPEYATNFASFSLEHIASHCDVECLEDEQAGRANTDIPYPFEDSLNSPEKGHLNTILRKDPKNFSDTEKSIQALLATQKTKEQEMLYLTTECLSLQKKISETNQEGIRQRAKRSQDDMNQNQQALQIEKQKSELLALHTYKENIEKIFKQFEALLTCPICDEVSVSPRIA